MNRLPSDNSLYEHQDRLRAPPVHVLETRRRNAGNATSQTPPQTSSMTTPVSPISSVESIHSQIPIGPQSTTTPNGQQAPPSAGLNPRNGISQQNRVNGRPPPQLGPSTMNARNPRFERLLSFLSEMRSPMSLILVYSLTVGIISTASSVYGPLAKTGMTSGFLLLNILALANNYAFLAAADKVWECLQWGDLLRGGGRLSTFLALSSSTGPAGWMTMLFRWKRYDSGGHPRLWSFGR